MIILSKCELDWAWIDWPGIKIGYHLHGLQPTSTYAACNFATFGTVQSQGSKLFFSVCMKDKIGSVTTDMTAIL